MEKTLVLRKVLAVFFLCVIASDLEGQDRPGEKTFKTVLPEFSLDSVGSRLSNIRDLLATSPIHALLDIQLSELEFDEEHGDSLIGRRKVSEWAVRYGNLPSPSTAGLYLDPLARITFLSGNYPKTRQLIAQRLSEPGVALRDREYTLVSAIKMFGTDGSPEAIQIAEQYLSQLDSLGGNALRSRIESRYQLLNAIGRLGNSAMLISYVSQVTRLLSEENFDKRRITLQSFPYEVVRRLISGMNDGRRLADSLNHTILALVTPTEKELLENPLRAKYSSVKEWKDRMARFAMIGAPAPPIYANAWLNMSDTTYSPQARPVSFADGKVRVVEFGDFSCPYCMAALPRMEWLQQQFSRDNVEVVYVTYTVGFWGADTVSALDELAAMRDAYTNPLAKGLTFPIAVWVGEKHTAEDGGMVPLGSPNTGAYRIQGKPAFVVIDGRGIIRYTQSGFGPGGEVRLAEQVRSLLHRQTDATSSNRSLSQ